MVDGARASSLAMALTESPSRRRSSMATRSVMPNWWYSVLSFTPGASLLIVERFSVRGPRPLRLGQSTRSGGVALGPGMHLITTHPGSVTTPASGSPAIVTGLTNGDAYTFTVVETNTHGSSSPSSPSSAVTPLSSYIPPSPTGLTATPVSSGESLTWTPDSGGAAAGNYTEIIC
jgi:hypothetical protein